MKQLSYFLTAGILVSNLGGLMLIDRPLPFGLPFLLGFVSDPSPLGIETNSPTVEIALKK